MDPHPSPHPNLHWEDDIRGSIFSFAFFFACAPFCG